MTNKQKNYEVFNTGCWQWPQQVMAVSRNSRHKLACTCTVNRWTKTNDLPTSPTSGTYVACNTDKRFLLAFLSAKHHTFSPVKSGLCFTRSRWEWVIFKHGNMTSKLSSRERTVAHVRLPGIKMHSCPLNLIKRFLSLPRPCKKKCSANIVSDMMREASNLITHSIERQCCTLSDNWS